MVVVRPRTPAIWGSYADIVTSRPARQRIVRICESARDSRSLRIDVLAALRPVVDFDAYVWMLTDPETCVGALPLADVPSALLPELPRLIGLKYLTAVNRWTGLSTKAVRLTDPARRSVRLLEFPRPVAGRWHLRRYGTDLPGQLRPSRDRRVAPMPGGDLQQLDHADAQAGSGGAAVVPGSGGRKPDP